MDLNSKIYIAGHRGLAGSAIWRLLEERGFQNLVGLSSQELDLKSRRDVFAFFESARPEIVVDAAARVGGIGANAQFSYDFLSENLQIQVNLMDAAYKVGVDRLLFLGSSCIYPKFAAQPIRESDLMTGHLEETNNGYAVAKITGVFQVQTARRQGGKRWISAMPTNLYGPGDNFSLENGHVLATFIRKFHEAKEQRAPSVRIWGTGEPKREFLFVDDFADAVLFLLQNYDDEETINVGSGREISIIQLAEMIATIVDYDGKIFTDPSKPDGTPRKFLDSSRLSSLGWTASTDLRDGIKKTYSWFQETGDAVRV